LVQRQYCFTAAPGAILEPTATRPGGDPSATRWSGRARDCSTAVLHVIGKGAPGNDPKLTTGDMSGFGGFNQAPRDKCPEGVVAAMRQLPTSLLKDRVHFHPGSFAELAHVMP
jgi:hypothetical protein